jgi:hypothetical protein
MGSEKALLGLAFVADREEWPCGPLNSHFFVFFFSFKTQVKPE